MTFSDLGLSKELLTATERANYSSPYPIQVQAIPALIKGNDLLGIAPTGSGKTAAYILHILQFLQKNTSTRHRDITVLVLVPNRELTAKVAELADIFMRFLTTNLKHKAV